METELASEQKKNQLERIENVLNEKESKIKDQEKATQMEVLALRTQVAYLQDLIEDLRKQLDSVVNVLDETGVPKLEGSDLDEAKTEGSRKKPGMKRPRSIGKLPLRKSQLDLDPISMETDDLEADHILSDGEIKQVCDMLGVSGAKNNLKNDKHPVQVVIKSISEATDLDEDSVCKIVHYFSKLTTKDTSASSPPPKGKLNSSNIPKVERSCFEKHEVALQAQKVGAN